MTVSILLLVTLLFSLLLTGFVYRFALSKSIFDIPNERSSHSVPTPRGGGIAVVLSFSLSLLVLQFFNIVSGQLVSALLPGGLVIAFLGLLDDLHGVSAPLRLLVQICAVLVAQTQLESVDDIALGHFVLHLGLVGTALAVLGVVWMINLFNFMDGIDGLVGTQGIFASCISGAVLWFEGFYPTAWVCFLLAAAIAGFLVWNWPPAKIFLGDVGSTWLGFTFAILIWSTTKADQLSLVFWIILFAIFISDTTFTLIKRFLNGEKWYAPHRSHAYQQWVIKGYSHLRVTVSVLCINLLVILPAAVLIIVKPAYAPFLLSFIFFGCWWLWMKGTHGR